jgi:hypothetical protein
MSHFTTLKTQLTEREPLLRAIEDLGLPYEEGQLEARGYQGIRTPVEIRVRTADPDYDLGFRKVGETYECVGDWHGIRGLGGSGSTPPLLRWLRPLGGRRSSAAEAERFMSQLTQRYAYHAAKAKLEAQGFAVASEETAKDGRIHLVLRRTT